VWVQLVGTDSPDKRSTWAKPTAMAAADAVVAAAGGGGSSSVEWLTCR
jgi:hypothetical protein